MANEVIIEEYASVGVRKINAPADKEVQIPGELITTQVLNIDVQSASFNQRTAWIRVQSKGTGFWYAVGSASVNSVANTAGNRWLPADQFRDISLTPTTDVRIDTAA